MSATSRLFKKIKHPFGSSILNAAKNEIDKRLDRRNLHQISISQRDKYGNKFAFKAFISDEEFRNAMYLATAKAQTRDYSDLEFVIGRQLLINFNIQTMGKLSNSGTQDRYIECLVLLEILIGEYGNDEDSQRVRDAHILNLITYLGIPQSIMDGFEGSLVERLTDALSMKLDILERTDLKRVGTAQVDVSSESNPADKDSAWMEAEFAVQMEFRSILDETSPYAGPERAYERR